MLCSERFGHPFLDLQRAGVALLAPRGTVLKPVMSPYAAEEDVADLPDLEEEQDLDDEVRNCVDEAEELFGPQQPLLDFEGGPKSKQHILNVVVNDALHASPRDRLQRALQQALSGPATEPTLHLSAGDGPIFGDTFATLVFYGKKSLAWPCSIGELSLAVGRKWQTLPLLKSNTHRSLCVMAS